MQTPLDVFFAHGGHCTTSFFSDLPGLTAAQTFVESIQPDPAGDVLRHAWEMLSKSASIINKTRTKVYSTLAGKADYGTAA